MEHEDLEKVLEFIKEKKKIPENLTISDLFELKEHMNKNEEFPFYLEFVLEKKRRSLK